MKILNIIESIFNTKQKKFLEELFFKKIGEGSVRWKDVLTEQLRKRLPNLVDGLVLDKVPGNSMIVQNKITEQIEDIEITLASLAAQSEDLNNTLSRHEMFRKDNVKSFFNIAQDYLDMINNEVKDYKTNNITVQNGVVELLSTMITDFKIETTEVEYFPDNYIDRSGNDPANDNVTPGTDKNYWLSEILTSSKREAGAKVTIGFNGSIRFNVLQISAAGKYALRIKSIETWDGVIWTEVPFSGVTTGKNFELKCLDANGNPTAYNTEFIRITIVKNNPDFIWRKTIDNKK